MTKLTTTPDGCALTWNGEPYGYAFETKADARSFVQFVGNRTGLDPYHQPDAALERLLADWLDT